VTQASSLDPRFEEILAACRQYLDGLHHSDTARLRQVFHPAALYACASEGRLTHMTMEAYFPMVDRRPSPASRNESRAGERIVSIEFAGPVTAFVRLECSIAEKAFTDLLTFVHLDGRWQIIAKVFHFEITPAAAS